MKYFVRTTDGKEYGPVDQEVLIQWAKAGRVTKDCEIRNSLMAKGSTASKVPYLKDIIGKQISFMDENRPVTTRVKNLINPEEDKKLTQGQSLGQSGKFISTAGPTDLRLGAWVVDTVILSLTGIGLFSIANFFIKSGIDQDQIFLYLSLAYLGCILMYYTILMGFSAQTVGQWVLGLMVVRKEGSPVFMGRAYFFSVFYILFFWSTVLFTFCFPSKRAIQDRLSGVKVIKIATD